MTGTPPRAQFFVQPGKRQGKARFGDLVRLALGMDLASGPDLSAVWPPFSPPTRLIGITPTHALVDEHAAEAPPLFPCAMTDIESLSLHPGNAFLLSQAVVPFRLTPEGPVMGPPLLLVFDLLEQLLSTRHIDDKTRGFWRDQPEAARAHFADPAYVGHGGARPVRTTMEDLATRIGDHLSQHCVPKGEVYSQGIAFDLSNLASAMFDAGDKTPWEYWAATDNRTLRRKLPKRRAAPKLDIPGAAHDPVYDCVKQIWALWEVATDEMLGVAPQAVAA